MHDCYYVHICIYVYVYSVHYVLMYKLVGLSEYTYTVCTYIIVYYQYMYVCTYVLVHM